MVGVWMESSPPGSSRGRGVSVRCGRRRGSAMASYRGHLATSTALGGVYAGAAMLHFGADWGTATLAGGLCAVGGLLPDLDSQSGVPVRELFGLSAVIVPLMLLRRLI